MNSLSRQFKCKILGWSAVGLAFSCSACANVSQTVRSSSSDNGPVQAIYKEVAKPTSKELFGSKSARKGTESEIQQLNFPQPQAGVTRVGGKRRPAQLASEGLPQTRPDRPQVQRDSDIQQVAYIDEQTSTIEAPMAAGVQPTRWVPHIPSDVECCPPEPRWPAAGSHPMAPGLMACDACNLPSPEKYTDEYLCDGGDRELPVHYDSVFRRGLDTEDTILEFTDADGNERMRPSNRVCVYAPRFASVRTVSRPHEEFNTDEVAGVGQLASTGGIHTRLKASNSVKREMTGRIAVRSRASGLETDAYQGIISQLRSPSVHDKLLNIYQAMSFVRFGRLNDADTARLNYGLQAASAWTREEYPVITAKTDMVLEGHFEQWPAVITGIDDRKSAEDLRIVKLADKKTAVTGDEIEFTIRYDNRGGREVHHIRIVDNLTPRLEYIDDSATSDRAGRLVLQDNGEGSQILIWELDEPLPGKSGGVVTFKTRVR